jgi:hypothetical protein
MSAQTALIIPFPKDAFAEAWDCLTPTMRRRSLSREKVRAIWKDHAKRVGAETLLAALQRYLKEDTDLARSGGPGLQVWLRAGRYDHWIGEAPATSTPALIAERRFADESLRESFVAKFTDERAIRWFDRCTLDNKTLVVPWPAKPEWIAGPFGKWAAMNGIHGWRLG